MVRGLDFQIRISVVSSMKQGAVQHKGFYY